MDSIVRNLLKDNIEAVLESGGQVSYGYTDSINRPIETITIHKAQLPSYHNQYASFLLYEQFKGLATNDERLDCFLDYIFNPKNVALVYRHLRNNGIEVADLSDEELQKHVKEYKKSFYSIK